MTGEVGEAVKSVSAAPAVYWFARRFPPDNSSKAMGPVHWKGWLAFAVFTFALIGGGMAFLLLAIWGALWIGLFAFALIAWGSMMALLKIVTLKGDQTKTMEDYMKAGSNVAR